MLSLLALGTLVATNAKPLLHLDLRGRILTPKGVQANFRPGISIVGVPKGIGFQFDGVRSALDFGDAPAFALRDSLTIALMINPATHVSEGPGAQIMFRGDDRSGLDPYHLTIHPDGKIYFGIEGGSDKGEHVCAPLQLGRWTHVVASLDAETRGISLWIDGQLVDYHRRTFPLLKTLDRSATPGFSIGNVQHANGIHNQPFKGTLADVTLWDRALKPIELGFAVNSWNQVEMVCGSP